jgi:hypothetical protein
LHWISAKFQPGNQRIHVNNFIAALEGVIHALADVEKAVANQIAMRVLNYTSCLTY